MQEILKEKYIDILKNLYKNKTDLNKEPLFDHIMRVYEKTYNGLSMFLEVALFHDAIEDGVMTQEDLEKIGLSKNVIEGITAITRTEGEDYNDYIKKVKGNRIAKLVKLYDIQDNMDVSRLRSTSSGSIERIKKYINAYNELQK